MTDLARSIAQVPPDWQADGIQWLVLEREESSHGWLLMGHMALERPCEFDGWHQTVEDAIREARRSWGVERGDWVPDLVAD